jgi:hypothetical protein
MLFVLLVLAATTTPPSDCTWINTATASGILGGPAHLTLSTGICEWTRDDSGKHATLRVEIIPLASIPSDYDKLRTRCKGAAIDLKALGNEAISCSDTNSEDIIGRVRDQGFVITLSGNSAGAKAGVRRAAGQVVGNLF